MNVEGLISVFDVWISSSEEPPRYTGPSSSRSRTGARFAGLAERGGRNRVPLGAIRLARGGEGRREGEDVGPRGEEAATWTTELFLTDAVEAIICVG